MCTHPYPYWIQSMLNFIQSLNRIHFGNWLLYVSSFIATVNTYNWCCRCCCCHLRHHYQATFIVADYLSTPANKIGWARAFSNVLLDFEFYQLTNFLQIHLHLHIKYTYIGFRISWTQTKLIHKKSFRPQMKWIRNLTKFTTHT